MALIRCGGSTEPTYTTLWTNENPTSQQTDSTVNLSQSAKDFDFVKITARRSTSDADEFFIIIDPNDWDSYADTRFRPSINVLKTGTGTYSRELSLETNTSVRMRPANQLGASGSDNALAIIIKIEGMNL